MANPKCGTCRFFQDNDLPGSGWCHHPQRKVSSDVKILVRRSELACRDDWSRSLWQPATGESVGDPGFMRPAASGALMPASPESLRAVLNRDLTVSAAADEDVLLSEGRIVSESAEPWEPPARPFPGGHFDPRTAILKAREAHRERIRANAMAARQSVEAGTGAFDSAGGETSGPEWSDDAGANGATGDQLPKPGRAEPAPLAVEATHSPEVLLAAPEASSADDQSREDERAGEADFWDDEHVDGDDEPLVASVLQPEVCAPEMPACDDDSAAVVEAQRSLVATALPGWFRADLPRVCRACRDFRPGTDGQRGWCANAWAFTHRQLVREEDVAPCHSAVGDWWVPVDDVWLVAADVSSHGRPTPLLDRMIGAESGQRRRS